MDKKLVRVTWIDASDPDTLGWHSDDEVDKFSDDKVEVTSVGYIKSSTKLYVTLVADYIENGDGSCTWGRPTKIPNGMIVKTEELVVKET